MTVKSALVTGASRGIGLGIARRLAEQGHRLTISARDPDRLAAVAAELTAAGAADVLAVPTDMADPEASIRLAEAHRERSGVMHALVLNAGVGSAGEIGNYSMGRFDKTVDVNLRAPFALLQETLPMLHEGARDQPYTGAKVIALSSLTGVYAEHGLAAYGASKAALLALVEAFNLEQSGHGVAATAVAPGYVDTDMAAWVHNRVPAESMITVGDIVELVDSALRLSRHAVVSTIVVRRAGSEAYRA